MVAQEDLRKLIQGAVRDLARQNAERAAPVDRSKGLKLAEQPDFTGRPEDLQDFLSNCEMMFVLKSDVYGRNGNDRKIGYAPSLMKKGNAALWESQYIRSNFTHGALTDTWNLFKDKLTHAFQDIGQAQNAMKMLGTMKQGSTTIEEFNTKFLINGGKAGMDFGDTITITQGQQNFRVANPHQRNLIHMYQNALNPKIAQQIIVNGDPETINAWMSRAAEIDSAYRRTNSLFSKEIQQKGRSAWKPRLHAREYNPGVPMDIGYIENRALGPSKGPRLTQAEENRRKEN